MLPITANQSSLSQAKGTPAARGANAPKLQKAILVAINELDHHSPLNQSKLISYAYVASPLLAESEKEAVDAKVINQIISCSLFNSAKGLNVNEVVKLANPQINGAGADPTNSFNPNACITAAMLVIFSILGESLQKTQDWQKDFMMIVSTLQSFAAEVAGEKQQESRELSIKHNQETLEAMRKGGIWKAILKIAIAIVTVVFTAPVAPVGAAAAVLFLATQVAGDIAQAINPQAAMDPNSKIHSWSQNGIFALADNIHQGLGNKISMAANMATLFFGQGASIASLAFSSTTGVLSKMASFALIADKGFQAVSSGVSLFDPKAEWASFGSMGALALAVHFGFSATGATKSDTGQILQIALCTLATLASGYAIGLQLKRCDTSKMQKLMPWIHIVTQNLNITAEALNIGNKSFSIENGIRTAAEYKFNADAELLQVSNQVTQAVYRDYLEVATKMNPELLKLMEAIIEIIRQTGQIFDDIYKVKHR